MGEQGAQHPLSCCGAVNAGGSGLWRRSSSRMAPKRAQARGAGTRMPAVAVACSAAQLRLLQPMVPTLPTHARTTTGSHGVVQAVRLVACVDQLLKDHHAAQAEPGPKLGVEAQVRVLIQVSQPYSVSHALHRHVLAPALQVVIAFVGPVDAVGCAAAAVGQAGRGSRFAGVWSVEFEQNTNVTPRGSCGSGSWRKLGRAVVSRCAKTVPGHQQQRTGCVVARVSVADAAEEGWQLTWQRTLSGWTPLQPPRRS